jgi:hypothetical protein
MKTYLQILSLLFLCIQGTDIQAQLFSEFYHLEGGSVNDHGQGDRVIAPEISELDPVQTYVMAGSTRYKIVKEDQVFFLPNIIWTGVRSGTAIFSSIFLKPVLSHLLMAWQRPQALQAPGTHFLRIRILPRHKVFLSVPTVPVKCCGKCR